jgi:hypothetical protein
MEVSGQLHALAASSPGKEPPLPIGLDRWLGGPQSWSGHGGEEKNSFIAPAKNRTCHSAHGLVTILTELPWLTCSTAFPLKQLGHCSYNIIV